MRSTEKSNVFSLVSRRQVKIELNSCAAGDLNTTTYVPLLGLDSMWDIETPCSSNVFKAVARDPGSSEILKISEVF